MAEKSQLVAYCLAIVYETIFTQNPASPFYAP
jgi:hypothetical protein